MATRYNEAESLFSALEDGSVALLKATWIISLHEKTKRPLKRRQDLPAAAFFNVDELRRMHGKSKAIVGKGHRFEFKPVPIVAVSHFWRTPEHPDPEGETLRMVATQLKSLLTERFSSGSTARELGLRDFGVFWDFGSLHQKPREPAEDDAFREALSTMDIWYAHALTSKIAITDTPADLVPYHERGWCTFEYQLMQLLLPSIYTSLWGHLVHNDSSDLSYERPTPVAPDAFFAGGKCGELTFTNGADRELVAAKWRDTSTHVLATATELLFQNAGWDDAEIAELNELLPLCTRLETLLMRGQNFTALPPAISGLRTLKTLGLQNCDQLVALPKALAELPKLTHIDCTGCDALKVVPEELRSKRKLQLVLPAHARKS